MPVAGAWVGTLVTVGVGARVTVGDGEAVCAQTTPPATSNEIRNATRYPAIIFLAILFTSFSYKETEGMYHIVRPEGIFQIPFYKFTFLAVRSLIGD